MLPFPHANHGAGGFLIGGAAVHVGSGKRDTGAGAGAIPLPPEASPFDILFVAGATVSGGAGEPFQSVSPGHARPIQHADIIGSLVLSTAPSVWALYRGPFALAFRQTATASGAGPLLPGITKASNCGGLILVGLGNASTTAPPSVGAPFTTRHTTSSGAFGPFWMIADLLDPDAYVNGTPIPMGGSSNGSTTGFLIEMLY
ncbi:MAG: hypothetical protein ACK41C_10500 [Phenylobacterium sp.]|uniref:hypothetical protein n=1 Tax=Phenylobacterium sp. TaxID=1871053 RepID=UPI00391B660E